MLLNTPGELSYWKGDVRFSKAFSMERSKQKNMVMKSGKNKQTKTGSKIHLFDCCPVKKDVVIDAANFEQFLPKRIKLIGKLITLVQIL